MEKQFGVTQEMIVNAIPSPNKAVGKVRGKKKEKEKKGTTYFKIWQRLTLGFYSVWKRTREKQIP